MILYTAFFLVSYLHCSFEFQTSIPVRNDFMTEWLRTHQLRRTIQIRQSDKIATPLTYGIVSPFITSAEALENSSEQRITKQSDSRQNPDSSNIKSESGEDSDQKFRL